MNTPKRINIEERKLLQETSPEFIEFMDELLGKKEGFTSEAMDKEHPKNKLYTQFREENPEYLVSCNSKGRIIQNTFTKWVFIKGL